MTTTIAFIIGLLFGGTVGFLTASVLASGSGSDTECIQIRDGIDPNELINWIENHTYNHEYTAPPTSGEIIRKIKEMAA